MLSSLEAARDRMAEEHFNFRNTIVFLRMAALQLRQIANDSNEPNECLKNQLRHMADQCETEVRELVKQFGLVDLVPAHRSSRQARLPG